MSAILSIGFPRVPGNPTNGRNASLIVIPFFHRTFSHRSKKSFSPAGLL